MKTLENNIPVTSNKRSNSVFFQPKLTINQPNDIYEQEADAMADRIMRMPDTSHGTFFKPDHSKTSIQRKCTECEEVEKESTIQRKPVNSITKNSDDDKGDTAGDDDDPAFQLNVSFSSKLDYLKIVGELTLRDVPFTTSYFDASSEEFLRQYKLYKSLGLGKLAQKASTVPVLKHLIPDLPGFDPDAALANLTTSLSVGAALRRDYPLESERDSTNIHVVNLKTWNFDLGGGGSRRRIHRKCANCEAEDKLLRKENNNSELENYTGKINSGGSALPDRVRSFFEPKFGYDFSTVRIHNDSAAADSAKSINALAYTSGNNIVFNSGQYDPGSESGKSLLAHELTHVVQQSNSTAGGVQKKDEPSVLPKMEDTPCERASLRHEAIIPCPEGEIEIKPCIWTMIKNYGPCEIWVYPILTDTPKLKAYGELVKIKPGEAKDVAAKKGCIRFEVLCPSECDNSDTRIRWGPPCAV